MENKQVKRYLIKFVKKVLNGCDLFTTVYGTDFVKQKLDANLEKVYTDIYSNTKGGEYHRADSSITIYKNSKYQKSLTIADIKKNWELQQIILHESIHAIFERTKEECEAFGIESGTGTSEVYNNGTELGRGLNEGLTEWIAEKAGYKARAYSSEVNLIRMLELAIGEEAVMQLAKGNIRGNVAQLLQMSEEDCVQILAQADYVYQCEQYNYRTKIIIGALSRIKNKFLTKEDHETLKQELGEDYERYIRLIEYNSWIEDFKEKSVEEQIGHLRAGVEFDNDLDSSIYAFERKIFEKFFKREIEEAQSAETISKEKMQRLKQIHDSIHGGKLSGSSMWESSPTLKYKHITYKQLTEKYMATLSEQEREEFNKTGEVYPKSEQQIIDSRKARQPNYEETAERTNLPVVLKKGLFQKIKDTIKKTFIRKYEPEIMEKMPMEMPTSKQQEFKGYISNMANFLEEPARQTITRSIEKTEKEYERHS